MYDSRLNRTVDLSKGSVLGADPRSLTASISLEQLATSAASALGGAQIRHVKSLFVPEHW
jgi:hypothetical protein